MSLDDSTRAQRRAARPGYSTWLVANAGSGKTKVLTERVARLLLAGVQPQRILCLTYTKAAASEMQNRLFRTLGSWTMLSNGRLAEELAGLGEPGPFPDDLLAQARTLFARAVETPGGLKIQTIHSFCSTVLRRFPLEAGVSPDFKEIDDRLAKLLQREVLEELALADDPGMVAMARYQTGEELDKWLGQVIRWKEALTQPKTKKEIFDDFEVPDGFDLNAYSARYLSDPDEDVIEAVMKLLSGGGKNDNSLAQKLRNVSLGNLTMNGIAVLEDALVFGSTTKNPFTAKSKTLPTKAGKGALGPELTSALHDLMSRVAEGLSLRRALAAAEKTVALHQFAASFLPAYEARKSEGGWLDFDDLISRTRALLSHGPSAAWVLYKLDGGIDHILVDEAQDTSPEQWEVIRTLAEEFLAGEGASDAGRTIFVVGDKKQSIYSFQGADPHAFDDMRAHFERMLAEAPEPLQDAELLHSFRSSPAILKVVDTVFEQSGHDGLGQQSQHKAFKDQLPGRVDLLDPWEKVGSEKGAWHEAVDRLGDTDHRRQMAEALADRISAMIGSERIPIVDRKGRHDKVVEPKDILILVQRRSEVFNEIIRACKARGIPMAGADQLNVAQELAVRDITAILSFLATPEDDLALASTLKSPFFGWDDAALFELAHNRSGAYLWQALRERQAEYHETFAVLRDMRDRADFLRPYELIERLLTWHDGRHLIRARLGAEADDAIDALLAQALAYEQSETPSLTGFLTWLGADDVKIKRAIDSAANVVRVMTVHGSKGLEAPIVIMPDTALRRAPTTDDIAVEDDLVVWRGPKADAPPDRIGACDEEVAKRKEEAQRLLYVAMTRAECWLIVAAAGEIENKTSRGWYAQISQALGELETDFIDGGRRYEPLPWPDPADEEESQISAEPDRLSLPAPASPVTHETIAATDLGGAKTVLGTEEDEDALERGTAIHALLENLPNMPRDLWSDYAAELGAAEHLAEARGIFESPELQILFAPGTLAEVPLTAELGGRRLHGIIDRLVFDGEQILAVDFKSNRKEPGSAADVPEGLLRQMGAYSAALGQIFPDKNIRLAILWTHSARLMELTQASVMEALQRSGKA